jgi:hypothetical protein
VWSLFLLWLYNSKEEYENPYTFDHALLHSLMETTSWIWTSLEQMLLGQVTNLK